MLNKDDYLEKCQDLLKDDKTYTKLKRDPTAKFKQEFVDALMDLKARKVITPPVAQRPVPH